MNYYNHKCIREKVTTYLKKNKNSLHFKLFFSSSPNTINWRYCCFRYFKMLLCGKYRGKMLGLFCCIFTYWVWNKATAWLHRERRIPVWLFSFLHCVFEMASMMSFTWLFQPVTNWLIIAQMEQNVHTGKKNLPIGSISMSAQSPAPSANVTPMSVDWLLPRLPHPNGHTASLPFQKSSTTAAFWVSYELMCSHLN